jgi:hypothetical protein
MDESLKTNGVQREQLVNLLYNEFQYRHSLLWSVTRLYIILVASLYAYPLFSINTIQRQEFGFRLLVFPLLAVLATFIGWWHIKCESARFKVVSDKYNETRGIENRPKWIYQGKRNLKEQLISEDMNELFLSLFFMLSLIFFLFGTLIILDFGFPKIKIHPYTYLVILPIPVICIVVFLVKYHKKKIAHNKKYEENMHSNCIQSINYVT